MSDSEGPERATEGEDVFMVLAAVDTSALASKVVETAARLARRTWPNAQVHPCCGGWGAYEP